MMTTTCSSARLDGFSGLAARATCRRPNAVPFVNGTRVADGLAQELNRLERRKFVPVARAYLRDPADQVDAGQIEFAQRTALPLALPRKDTRAATCRLLPSGTRGC